MSGSCTLKGIFLMAHMIAATQGVGAWTPNGMNWGSNLRRAIANAVTGASFLSSGMDITEKVENAATTGTDTVSKDIQHTRNCKPNNRVTLQEDDDDIVVSTAYHNDDGGDQTRMDSVRDLAHAGVTRNENTRTPATAGAGELGASIVVDRNNVYFYGTLTTESCAALRARLVELNEKAMVFKMGYGSPAPPIRLHIQSNGGSLMDSLYLVDVIKNMDTPVHTYVDGYAASAATLLSVSGSKRYMTKNSMMLIHQLSGGQEGKYGEMDDAMKNMQMLMKKLRNVYIENSAITESELNGMLTHDLWLDAQMCKKLKLVDEIL